MNSDFHFLFYFMKKARNQVRKLLYLLNTRTLIKKLVFKWDKWHSVVFSSQN